MHSELEQQLIRAIADEPADRELLLDALYAIRRATWSRAVRHHVTDPTDRRHYVKIKLASLGRAA